MREHKITRRDAIKAGAALAGAAALQAGNLALFAQAWAQSSPWKATSCEWSRGAVSSVAIVRDARVRGSYWTSPPATLAK